MGREYTVLLFNKFCFLFSTSFHTSEIRGPGGENIYKTIILIPKQHYRSFVCIVITWSNLSTSRKIKWVNIDV